MALTLYHCLCYSLMCWLFVWFCVFFRSVSCLVFSHATKHRSCFGGRTATKVWNGCTPKVAHSYEHEPLPEHEPIAIMTTIHRFQASSSTFVIENRLPSRGENNNAAPRPRRSNDAKKRPRVRMCTYEESIFPLGPSGHYPSLSSPRIWATQNGQDRGIDGAVVG